VAALIALETTVPYRRAITYATAALLFVLGLVMLAAPDAIPGLMIPGDGGATMHGGMPMR
jgi:hypothetical protein